MHQPVGFVNPNFPNHICKLRKSIHGLKLAPRAWFSKLTSKLLTLGFHGSISDPSLFILSTGSDSIYVLIYVDDIIIISSKSLLITEFISSLRSDFPVKDLGFLHYFLGIKVRRDSTGLFLS